MKERIIEFLKAENKSSAQFALEIGVQPSSISHIISGRNNPSLDFIMKMLSRYTALSADWLLFGKGQMLRKKAIGDLFDSPSTLNLAESDEVFENKLIDGNRTNEDLFKQMPVNEKEPLEDQFTKAKRIICFFENNTFTEYFPSKE